jgi:hypothetical protein
VSLILPGGDWRSSGVVLRTAADPKDNVVLKYGDFIGAVVDFLLVAFVLFIVVSKVLKGIEARTTKKIDEPPATKECKFCCETIPVKATRPSFSDFSEEYLRCESTSVLSVGAWPRVAVESQRPRPLCLRSERC